MPCGRVILCQELRKIERQKIGVPSGVEGNDAEGRHRWTGERQGDLQEGADVPGAIDAGCVKELLRHLLEELPHQEDAKGADEARASMMASGLSIKPKSRMSKKMGMIVT